jgi:hypothetical protein
MALPFYIVIIISILIEVLSGNELAVQTGLTIGQDVLCYRDKLLKTQGSSHTASSPLFSASSPSLSVDYGLFPLSCSVSHQMIDPMEKEKM